MISLDKIRQAKNIGNRGEDWENIQYIAGKVQPVSPVQPTQNYTDLVNRTENVKSIMKGFGDFRVAEGRSTNIYGMGSIDLTKRPVVKNSDGTVSTIRSISFSDDSGKEILIPTVSKDGRIMSNDEAIKTYYKTGEYLGKFDTVNEANKYAEKLHQEQAVTPTTIDKPKYYNSVAEKMRAIQKKDTTPKFEQSYGTGQALPSSFGDVVKSFMFGVAENSVGWLNKLTDKMLYDWNKAAGYKKPKGYDIVEDAKKEAEADLREAHKKWDAAKDPAEYAKLQEEFAATMSEGEKKVKEAETKKAVDTRRTFLGQDEYWEPTESTEKAEAIGQVGGGVLKTIGISSLAGLAGGLSSGVAKDIVTRTITGIGLGLAKGIEEDADLQDFLVNIGRETLYMNVGGAASDVVGGLTLKQIMSSAYKDSLLAEVGRQALKGAAFGAAGTAATMPTYPEGQKPTVKDIAIRAATGALFDAVTGLARELKLSEYNKNRILGGMAEFEGELLRGLGEAKTSASPEEAIAKYESLLEQVEAAKEALKQNRFIGQTEKVKEALSIMDYIHNRISLEVDGLKPATPQIGGTDIQPVTSPAIAQPAAPQPATAKPAVTPAVPQTRLPDTVTAQQPTETPASIDSLLEMLGFTKEQIADNKRNANVKEQIISDRVKPLQEKIESIDKQIEDWRSRVYKTHGGTVKVGDFDEVGDTPWRPGVKNVSVDKINEARRQNRIQKLEEQKEDIQRQIAAIQSEDKYFDASTLKQYDYKITQEEIQSHPSYSAAQQPTPPAETKTGESGVTVLPETREHAKADTGVAPVEAEKPDVKPGNMAYHAGDLGKSEAYGRFYGSARDTGHFGTGTYFVSDKAKLNIGSYKDRPMHEADLSGYNLYKPKNANEAEALHDILKYANNYFGYSDMRDLTYDEIRSLKGDPEEAHRVLTEYGMFNEEEFKNLTGYTYKQVEEGQIWNKDIADAFDKQLSRLDDLRKRIDRAQLYLDIFTDRVEELFDISSDEAEAILQSIHADMDKKMEGKNFYTMGDMKDADSISTQFMKKLGYEGVDVRHIPEFDNTQYGTVVYDLKKTEPAKATETKTPAKEAQLKVIQETNPAPNKTQTWVRSVDDIKTYQEAVEEEGAGDQTPDYTESMIKKAIETGRITVYSSYPIEPGVFVTPSKMEAASYAGSNKVHEKEVALSDVAWLDVIQGQYAPAETVKVETKAPAKEPPTGTYRYYTTQRPPAPGAVPGKAVNTVAFDDRQDVPDVGKAWGYVEYAEPLTEKQISEYELAKVKPVSEYQQKRDKHDAQADEIKRYQMLGIEKTGVRLQDAEATGRMIELFYKGEITQEQLDKYINSLIYENRISDKSVLGEELINKALASKAEASAPKAKTEQPPAKEGKPTSPKADLKPVDKTEAIEKSKKDLRVAANEAQLKKLTPAQRKMYDHLYSFDGNSDALLETLNVKKASTPGFTDYQRQELIEGLVKGYLGEKPFDKGQYVHVSIPDDGTFDVTNQPLHVAAVLNKLGVEVASGLDLIPKPLLKAIKAAYKKSAIGSYKDDVLIGGYFAYRLSPDALGALKKEYEKMGEYTSKIDITDRLLGASFYDDEKVLTEPYITKSKFMDMYKNSMLFIGQDNNLNFFNKTYVDILKDKNVQLYLKEMAPGDKNKALLGVRDNEVTGFVLPIAKEHADKEYLDNLANPEYFMPAKGYVAGDKAISKAKSVPSEYEGAKPGDIDYKPIRVGMQTQIVSGTPSGQTSPYTFADPDIEETHQKNKGVPVATFGEKVTNAMTELKHMFTRPISTLPYTPEFAKLYFRLLNNFRSLRGMVADSTIRTLKDITGKMTNNEFDLFSRKVLLDDLAEDVALGNSLPNKWTPDMVDSELKRLDSVMPQIVKDGIAKRKKYWADLVDEFIAAKKSVGLDVADTFERKDYFRHQVLEYMDAKRSIRGVGKRLKSPARAGFEMQRSGEYEGDINTDYFQAEYEVMAQMKYNIGVIETINYIDKHYNIADKVKAAAKATGLDNWRDAIPEGYTIWQPKPGNVFYLRQPLGADLVTRVLANENLKLDDVKDPVLKKALEDIMNELAGETAVLAMGGKRKEWVVKQEVADTLNNLNQAQPTNVLTRTSTRIQNEWKRWVTGLNPKTTIKFGVRNVSGDLEGALQGNPRTLLRVPKAIKELREAIYNGNFTPDILEWYNMGGMQSLFYPREVSDVDKLEPFKKFRKLSLGEKLTKPLKDYAGFTEDMHDFREAILRYASYLDYMDQLREGKLLNYGASNRKLIDALGSNEEKAFKLSNDLIGGYNEISQFGQVMRKHFVPFYSWEEIAVKRQFNLLRNAFTSEDAAKAAGVSAATIAKLGLKTVGYLVKMFAFTAAVAAFNMLKFSDLIDEIPEDVKARPYLILGKNKNGQVIYFSRLGALTEVLEWVGLDSAPQDIKEILNGEKMLSEWTTEILKAPLNKAMSTLTPFIKTPLELLSGMSIYPDATKPRAIRDRWQHLAQSLSLRDEYDVLAGKPHRPYFENLDKALIYKSDPLEAAYYEILNAKRRYKERKGEESLSFFYTKKSNALYNYKLAIRYGDEKAQEKYLKEYEKYGGNSAQTIRNIITMSPYYGIRKDEREDFKNSLGSDKKKLEQAEEFFIDMLETELSTRRPITAGTQLMIDLYRETGETLQFPKTVATEITVNKVTHKLTTDEIIEYQNLANDAMYKRADELAKNTKILSLPPMEQVQILSDELNKQVAIVRDQWKKRYR